MSETAQLTPQQRKENYIQSLQAKLEGWLSGDAITTNFTTSSCAPAFGWSVEEHAYMPTVAQRLREKGYSVSSSVNHGVTDWIIAL